MARTHKDEELAARTREIARLADAVENLAEAMSALTDALSDVSLEIDHLRRNLPAADGWLPVATGSER